MSRFMLSYIERPSPVHRLTGAAKLAVFLFWSVLVMAGYDTRVMAAMVLLGVLLFAVSGIKLREISFILKFIVVFMILNLLAIYLFAPEQGTAIYGTRHVLWNGAGRYTITRYTITRYTITAEQLFYEFNVLLKYLSIIPAAILLIVTTQPSEFAASLNRVGVPYQAAYSVSLALRYIPDIQRDYENISQAQQARGTELSRKANPLKRLKNAARILLPLVFSSLDRIDTISRAMELRGFGKHRKRSWYSGRPFARLDRITLAVSVVLFVLGLYINFSGGSRFYNPWK